MNAFNIEDVLLTDQRGFQIADFPFPKFTSESIKFSYMFALVMAFDTVSFHNRNHSLADETNRFTITFNKEDSLVQSSLKTLALSQTFHFFDAMF
jgi:hypothetical protein